MATRGEIGKKYVWPEKDWATHRKVLQKKLKSIKQQFQRWKMAVLQVHLTYLNVCLMVLVYNSK